MVNDGTQLKGTSNDLALRGTSQHNLKVMWSYD